jgi:hypothetical protein
MGWSARPQDDEKTRAIAFHNAGMGEQDWWVSTTRKHFDIPDISPIYFWHPSHFYERLKGKEGLFERAP